jgi:RimJ/RimL family protein N-acetyltransferase
MPPPPPDLPTAFETEWLLLRPYRPADAALYFQMVRENWDHLYEFLPEPVQAMQSEDDAAAFLRWLDSEWQQRRLFLLSLWEKATGRYVGETYLANPDWTVLSLELGYFLVQAATGQGYATEAARAAVRWAFDGLAVSRLDLQCRADNPASQRVAERLGFRLEGRQRLRHRKKDGTLVDRLWYGLLRADWQSDLQNSIRSPL